MAESPNLLTNATSLHAIQQVPITYTQGALTQTLMHTNLTAHQNLYIPNQQTL